MRCLSLAVLSAAATVSARHIPRPQGGHNVPCNASPSAALESPSASIVEPASTPVVEASTSVVGPASTPVAEASTSVVGPASTPVAEASTSVVGPASTPVAEASTSVAEAASTSVVVPASSSIAEAASTSAVEPTSTVVTSHAAVSSDAASSASTVAATQFCGAPNDYEVLMGTPWIVYSMNYNYEDISGTCCTNYYDYTGTDDNQTIHWSSVWDIDESVSTDVVKGYSFIGLTENLETQLSAISSIPSTYEWTISNTTAYKGNVVYDFMTSDTKGDSTSSAAQELMLWLQWEGGQVPIGWADGVVATIDGLFGKDGWQLYQGENTGTGITVSSLLAPADDMFDGSFDGDIKDWLTAISEQGVFSTSTYVNVGNAGMEPYWGTVTFDNHLSLRIDL